MSHEATENLEGNRFRLIAFRAVLLGVSVIGAFYLVRLSAPLWSELDRSLVGNDSLGVTTLLLMLVGLLAAVSVPLVGALTLRQIRVNRNGFLPQFRSLTVRRLSKPGEIPWGQVSWIDELSFGEKKVYVIHHVSGKTFSIPEAAFRERDREKVRLLMSDVRSRLSKGPTWSKPERRGLFSK